jgi:hypothetical protein
MRGVIVGTGKRLTEVVHRMGTLLTSGSHKSRELQESKARLEEAQRVRPCRLLGMGPRFRSRNLV